MSVHISINIRLGFDIPKVQCVAPLGLENGNIKDSAIATSGDWSSFYRGAFGRLNLKATKSNSGAWSAKKNSVGQWFQVDFGTVVEVRRVATQGRQNRNQWVTSYTLAYSNNGADFVPYGGKRVRPEGGRVM